jgi:hypothetical protein
MTHSHDHHHDPSAYYTEQLCTIGICGMMGGVAIALYATGGLNKLLAHGILQYSVLAGGVALLVLVAVRAVALWIAVGKPAADCDHDHDDCCDHDHVHKDEHAITTADEGTPLVSGSAHAHQHHHHDHAHGHDHSHGGPDHSHDHSWTPIKYIVLLVPVLLYFLVPLKAVTTARGYDAKIDPAEVVTGQTGTAFVAASTIAATFTVNCQSTGAFVAAATAAGAAAVNATDTDVLGLSFHELDGAASVESRRKRYDGRIARLTGIFVPSPYSSQFSLVRWKIRCCARDGVPLPFPILVSDTLAKDLPAEQRLPDAQALNQQWVEVTCQILFRQHPERPNEWITLLVVRPTKEMPITELIKQIPPDPDPYL